MYISLLIYFRR